MEIEYSGNTLYIEREKVEFNSTPFIVSDICKLVCQFGIQRKRK